MNLLLDLDARPVIGHRGAAAHAPENTLAGFSLATGQGAEALELDVHASADGVPVVIHDPTLDRTTDRTGAVADLAYADIRQADAGARFTTDGGRSFPFRGRGVVVPRLEEVLEAVPTVPLLIEIKDPRAQAAVKRALLERRAAERCVVAAELAEALDLFREPPFQVGAARPDIARLLFRATLGVAPRAVAYRCLAVPERHNHVIPVATRRFIAAARRLGCPVHVWTVNGAERARRLWAKGACGMVTDEPGRIRRVRESLEGSR